jgi:hypothetical protein
MHHLSVLEYTGEHLSVLAYGRTCERASSVSNFSCPSVLEYGNHNAAVVEVQCITFQTFSDTLSRFTPLFNIINI